MKKVLPILLLAVTIFLLITSLFFCIFGFYDINCVLEELASNPSASGIDFFGIGWGYGFGLFFISIIGLIISIINKKVQHQRVLKIISLVAIFVFILLIVTSAFLFFR